MLKNIKNIIVTLKYVIFIDQFFFFLYISNEYFVLEYFNLDSCNHYPHITSTRHIKLPIIYDRIQEL